MQVFQHFQKIPRRIDQYSFKSFIFATERTFFQILSRLVFDAMIQFRSASTSIEIVVFRLKMSELHLLKRWQGEAEASGHPEEQQRNKQFLFPSLL
uniref:NR LBD domain-containing protein n=1 Tax=Caenorhabditis tropicalis TaxID=1561998 RepID=A0A1I7U6Y2_9PELO